MSTITRIYVGEGFDAHGFASHLVGNEVTDGATIIPATGLWRDQVTGEVFDEQSHIIELVGLSAAEYSVIALKYTVPQWLHEHDESAALVIHIDNDDRTHTSLVRAKDWRGL